MRTPLERRVLQHLRGTGMVRSGDRVGVAVSGGADSVALLRLLKTLRGELGITLSVLHFDHQLRGAESEADSQFVLELARALGLECILERADVGGEAKRRHLNLEEAARRLRYGFFERVIERGAATRVAVAHTADDQAETVMAHLIRGTGTTGLAAIYPVAGAVVRPLLGIRRAELRGYLNRIAQTSRQDASNQDPHRLRARIRMQLLPQIERDFSPRIAEHLCELARFCREEHAFWEALVDQRYDALVYCKGEARVISVEALLHPFGLGADAPRHEESSDGGPRQAHPADQPWRALTERLVRRLYQAARGDRRELIAEHVEQVIRLASQSTSGRRIELPGGIGAERRFGEVFFVPRNAAEAGQGRGETVRHPIAYHYLVDLPARGTAAVSVPELGVRFCLKLIDWAGARSETRADSQVLDVESLRAPLILRNWRPGDAYTPYGRRQTRKLKQMLLAARVPVGARKGWPVLESAGQVVWARGMPVAAGFCAGGVTRRGLVIEESKL
jgi:tRNA(Ile)-lysidine synthase